MIFCADCHNDTVQHLREHAGISLLPSAQLDLSRFQQYLDLGFFAIWTNRDKCADQTEEAWFLLHKLLAALAAEPAITVLRNREQLAGSGKLALLALEDAAPLGENACQLPEFFAYGLRSVGLTWNYNNRFAGCAQKGGAGLTEEGAALVKACNAMGVLLDAAHASSATLADLLRLSQCPVIDTHTVCGALNARYARAVSDDEIRTLAAAGGVVGICFVPDFLGGIGGIERVCDHVEHALALVGSEHVALGSDFDGCEPHPELAGVQFLPTLYKRLAERGMPDTDLANIAGESVRRLLRVVLPAR